LTAPAPAADPTPAADPAPAPVTDPAPAPVADPAPAPASIPADPAPAPVTDPGTADPAPADPGAVDPGTGEPKSYDEGYVKGLRTENANWRTKHRDAEARATEFEQKYNDIVANLGKLGGFTPDDPAAADTPPDPNQALQDMSAKLRDYQLRDAVREAAADKADTAALLDSTSFLATVRDLDPSADDYAAQVAAAVDAAVTANPRFASAPVVPARSGGDTSTGTGEPGPLTDEQFAALGHKDRLQALADGRYKP